MPTLARCWICGHVGAAQHFARAKANTGQSDFDVLVCTPLGNGGCIGLGVETWAEEVDGRTAKAKAEAARAAADAKIVAGS